MNRVLITGANKGIGLATVKKLLESYSDTYVLLGSRNFKKGEQALENLLKSKNFQFNKQSKKLYAVLNMEIFGQMLLKSKKPIL